MVQWQEVALISVLLDGTCVVMALLHSGTNMSCYTIGCGNVVPWCNRAYPF